MTKKKACCLLEMANFLRYVVSVIWQLKTAQVFLEYLFSFLKSTFIAVLSQSGNTKFDI